MREFCLPFVFFIFLLLYSSELTGQEKKQLIASRFIQPPKIDGRLDDSCWMKASEAVDFVQIEPYNGLPPIFSTRVLVGYDDFALYIGARLYDSCPDSISLELHERDNMGLADYFEVILDPFDDGLNALSFAVTARGVQVDMKMSNRNDFMDESWDAVWNSAVSIDDQGWVAEMSIPYSALRFPELAQQQWGINFKRSVQRKREYDCWNLIDVHKSGTVSQLGILLINDALKSPLRLSATPYLAASTGHNTETVKWNSAYNYGMDLKLGLSKSFTLDVTLIPDFGQVESDKLIYSLTPFEVYYDEKRPFFTEGTELFSKGGLFYSRRIGAEPKGYQQVAMNYDRQQIVSNPETVQLINAAKLSGKNSRGLGVGLFNAITANTWAKITTDSSDLKILTEPYTNYNMLVFEQAMPNNSQISLYNTNVAQPDKNRMANVTGTEVAIRNKRASREIYAMFNVSQEYRKNQEAVTGESLQLSFGKIDGTVRPSASVRVVTDAYNPNDMGYLKNNNEIVSTFNLEYHLFEPNSWRLKWDNIFEFSQFFQYAPFKFSKVELSANSYLTTAKRMTIGGHVNIYPLGELDFFEARCKGHYFQKPWSFNTVFFVSPDYRKKFLVDYNFGVFLHPEWNRFNWWLGFSPRWRIKDHVLLVPGINYDDTYNDIGYAAQLESENNNVIVFGQRRLKNLTTSFDFNYAFNAKSVLVFGMRHYWLLVDYQKYMRLLPNAGLENIAYDGRYDFSVNTFNIDLVYKWNFAPGSELLFIWKNAVYTLFSGDEFDQNYFRNLEKTFNSPMGNSLSVKLLYYIDWQQLTHLKQSWKTS